MLRLVKDEPPKPPRKKGQRQHPPPVLSPEEEQRFRVAVNAEEVHSKYLLHSPCQPPRTADLLSLQPPRACEALRMQALERRETSTASLSYTVKQAP